MELLLSILVKGRKGLTSPTGCGGCSGNCGGSCV